MTTDIDELVRAAKCALGYLTGNMDGDMDLGDPREMLRTALAPFTKPKLVYVMPEWEEFTGGYLNGAWKISEGFWIERDTYNALRDATRVEEKA